MSARSWWKGYVDETSRAQKVVIAVGSIATAVVAIGTAVVSLAGWFGGDDGEGGGGERVRPATAFDGRVIESGTDDGDDLVRFLIAASGGEPVELNLTVLAPGGVAPDPYLPLWYNCAPGAVVGSGACNRVRLEFGSDTPVLTRNPVGWRFRGTYRVLVRNGVDYGTDLDIGFDDIST